MMMSFSTVTYLGFITDFNMMNEFAEVLILQINFNTTTRHFRVTVSVGKAGRQRFIVFQYRKIARVGKLFIHKNIHTVIGSHNF